MTKELKTQKTTANVPDFLDSIQNPDQRKDCIELGRIMQEITGSQPDMWGSSVIGYGRFPYRYASGRTGEWFRVGFSPRKKSITLYLVMGFKDVKSDLANLGKHSTGKSCLYIQSLADIEIKILKKLIKTSADQAETYLNNQ